MQWGSVAELTTAVATVGALLAAALAARAAIQTNNRQNRRLLRLEVADRERSAAAERRQAEAVACWISLDKSSGLPVVCWTNSSGSPVYNVTLFLSTPCGTTEVRYTFGSPTSPPSLPRAQRLLLDEQGGLIESWERLLDEDEFRVAVIFRDCANRWWLRDYDGVLSGHPDEVSARLVHREALRRFLPRLPMD